MPVQTRKYFIARHNKECDDLEHKYNKSNTTTITGEATSKYTQISMVDYGHTTPKY